MIWINPFFLCQRSYHFRRNWSYISFPFPFQSFYVFPRPFETPKNEQLFFGTHTRFVIAKRIMVTPPLTTSFMNFIVIEIHVLPRQNLELAILLPSRQRFTSVERMIRSDRHESPTTLPESMLYIWKRLTSLLLSWYTPLPAEPPFSSIHREKMEDWCQQFITEERTH